MDVPAKEWPVAPLQGAELDAPALTQELVDKINGENSAGTWTAELSPRFKDITLRDAKVQMGSLLGGPVFGPLSTPERPSVAVPENFDWREKMGSKCPSISEVRD